MIWLRRSLIWRRPWHLGKPKWLLTLENTKGKSKLQCNLWWRELKWNFILLFSRPHTRNTLQQIRWSNPWSRLSSLQTLKLQDSQCLISRGTGLEELEGFHSSRVIYCLWTHCHQLTAQLVISLSALKWLIKFIHLWITFKNLKGNFKRQMKQYQCSNQTQALITAIQRRDLLKGLTVTHT